MRSNHGVNVFMAHNSIVHCVWWRKAFSFIDAIKTPHDQEGNQIIFWKGFQSASQNK